MFRVSLLCLGLFSSAAAALRPPPSPTPSPTPPANVQFCPTLSDYGVLQQAGANSTKSAVYGTASANAMVTVTVTGAPSVHAGAGTGAGAGVAEYTISAEAGSDGVWKAYLQPAGQGGDVTVKAHCAKGCSNTTDVVLNHLTFGDVWYCAGQSNMWLPMANSYSRNYTIANISAGKYSNIRLMAGDSQHGFAHPWATAKQASVCTNKTTGAEFPCPYSGPTLFEFSAACWYFAEALTDQFVAAGQTPPVLGMINTAIGGSMIEEWSTNDTLATCHNTTVMSADQALWDKNVVPYLDMTVHGFVWYQGENNMHGVKGNIEEHTGYACMMAAMIASWREHWSAEPHTTDPLAPFGLVTIPDSGTEGGADVGAFRLAQTGSYGVLPNTAMPNTFLAQAFDLDDPWGDKTCYGFGCCNQYEGPGQEHCVSIGCDKPNTTVAGGAACEKSRCPAPFNATNCIASTKRVQLPPTACDEYCEVLHGTPVFMGGIHPRLKRPVGERLAIAAFNQVYGGTAAATGPTISSCSVTGSKLALAFDPTLMRSSTLVVQTNTTAHPTMLEVLTNASMFCIEPMLVSHNISCSPPGNPACHGHHWMTRADWECPDATTPEMLAAHTALLQFYDDLGGVAPSCPYETAWKTVVPTLGSAPGTVNVDLSAFKGGVFGVRYGIRGNCCDACGYRSSTAPDGEPCDKDIGITSPCPPAACPVQNSEGLPGNPFQARIIGGQCKCVAPQVC